MRARSLRRFVPILGLGLIFLPSCDPGALPDDADLEEADPNALTWVSPLLGAEIEAGEPVTLTVYTRNPGARSVSFSVNGNLVGACNPLEPESECRTSDLWRHTVTFADAGTFTLEAAFTTPNGVNVRATRVVEVRPATAGGAPVDPGANPEETDPTPEGELVDEGDAGAPRDVPELLDAGEPFDGSVEPFDTGVELPAEDAGGPPEDAEEFKPDFDAGTAMDALVRDAAPRDTGVRDAGSDARDGGVRVNRGYLDPSRGWHSVFGGIEWRVQGQRVLLRRGSLDGSVSAVSACMARYGASIRRYGDRYNISRASIVATAITESNCTNPRGSSDGLSSGPMQVTATTCAGVTGLPASTCRTRMHAVPDFSFYVGVRYMASSYQRRQHRNDPPKIAAAYNAGSIRRSSRNRWHMVVTGNHIDRFVAAYNAYRTWERRQGIALDYGPAEVFFEGEHVAREADLPASARDGQVYFVGDWANRNGHFYTYFNGSWHRD